MLKDSCSSWYQLYQETTAATVTSSTKRLLTAYTAKATGISFSEELLLAYNWYQLKR